VAEQTGKVPQALADRPSLREHLDLYLDAFYTLSQHRAHSMGGLLPIPFSEIRCYADEYGLESRDMRERLFTYVAALDRTYMAHHAKKQAEPTKIAAG
jgi:hypothetical protein